MIRLAEDALPESGADATDGAIIDLQRANVAIWQRDYRTALQLSRRNLRHTGLDPLTAMNINGAYLLSAVLCEEHDAVRHHLGDPDVEASRQAWLDRAPRGEHCLVSYEAIRGAARAWNGEHEAARRDLADALAMLGTDVMAGVDADFLGAFAWGCLACGELDRAAELLDDTYSIARSPNTMLVLTEARERAIGVTDATTEARIADLTRRSGLFDTINRENRTRRMLDSELDRLHLR